MKRIYLISLLLLYLPNLSAQIIPTGGQTSEALVETLVGNGITVSNISVDCSPAAYGTFEGTASNIDIDNGVLLTTGSIFDTPGPSASIEASTNNGYPGDADLDAIVGNNTFDACVLEFDFEAQGDELSFTYVFGSEEYPEFVGQSFNDGFALLISGPGITGAVNLAKIPGTNTAVSINNVNAASFPAYYVNNGSGSTVSYDGFTIPMRAEIDIIPCQTYHLKFVVADVADHSFDSGVFIEQGSISSNTVDVLDPVSTIDAAFDYVIEGCSQAYFSFVLPEITPTPFTIDFTVGGNAIMGVDYQSFPTSITIPAGQISKNLTITTLSDALVEGNESLEIQLFGPCSAQPYDVSVLVIRDELAVEVSEDTNTCAANEAIQLMASGGSSYTWTPSTGLSNPNIANPTATVTETTTYTVEVSDGPCSVEEDVTIMIGGELTSAFIGPDTYTCPGNPVFLGAFGGEFYNWSPATNLSCTDCPNPMFTPGETTFYTVEISNAFGCSSTFIVKAFVDNIALTASADVTEVCGGEPVTLTASGTASTFEWTDQTNTVVGTGQQITVYPTSSSTYTVTGGSSMCSGDASVSVTVNNTAGMSVFPSIPAICAGDAINITASGATSYTWTDPGGNTVSSSSSFNASPSITTTYELTGTSGNCSETMDVTVVVHNTPQLTILPENPTLCAGGAVELVVIDAEIGDNFTWSPMTGITFNSPDGSSVMAAPSSSTNYTITAVSNNTCTNTTSIAVNIETNLTISVNAPPVLCSNDDPAILTAFGADNYTWSPANGLSSTTGSSVTANPSVTTTYTVFGTDASGCDGTYTFDLVVGDAPQLTTVDDRTICAGESTSLDVDVTGGTGLIGYFWSPSTGLNNPSFKNPTVNVDETTTYTILVADSNGCTETDQVTVTVIPSLNPQIIPSATTLCSGETLELTASGGVNYQWSGTSLSSFSGATVEAFPGNTATYSVIVTDANGCTGMDQVTIDVIASDITVVADDPTICLGQSTTLTANGSSSYTWLPAPGLSSNFGNSVTVNPTETTTYTVTGSSSSGVCPAIGNITVQVSDFTLNVPETVETCAGQEVEITVSGASTYSWSPSTGLNVNSGATVIASPSTTTTYTVTGTDANGCSRVGFVTVEITTPPALTVFPPVATICIGSFTVFTLTGAESYEFQATEGQDFGIEYLANNLVKIIPTEETNFWIIGTDENGCTNTITAFINISSGLNLTATASDNVVCANGDSISISVVGASEFIWSPSTSLSSNSGNSVMALPTEPTTYTVSGSTINGCVGSTTIFIDVVEPDVTVSEDLLICPGESVDLSASGGTSYQWSPAAVLDNPLSANPTATIDATTIFNVEIMVGSCLVTEEVTVTVGQPDVTIVGGVPEICEGENLTLSAEGATSYTWIANGVLVGMTNSIDISPNVTTTYTLNGTTASGCSDSDVFTIIVNEFPTISANTANICAGESAVLNASGASAYTWLAGGMQVGTGSSISVTPTVTTNYTILGESAAGCENIGSTTVFVDAAPTVMASTALSSICVGDAATLTAEGASTYSWFESGSLVASGNILEIFPTATTTYTVVGQDGSNCEGTDEITILVNNPPTITATADVLQICEGESANLTASGGTNYNWLDEDMNSLGNGVNLMVTPITTTTYTLDGVDGTGCVGSTNITIEVVEIPDLLISPPSATVCPGGSAILTVSGAGTGANYSWSPTTFLSLNNAEGSSVTVNPTVFTTYTVTATTAEGCVNTSTVEVTPASELTIAIDPPMPTVCSNGGSIEISASGATTFEWSPATGLSSTTDGTVTAMPSTNTTYTVTGMDDSGCMGTLVFDVLVENPPLISAGLDETICEGGNLFLNVDVANPADKTFLWSPAASLNDATLQSPTAAPNTDTNYTVTVTDANGCESIDDINVTVSPNFEAMINADATMICTGNSANLSVIGGVTHQWLPADGLNSDIGINVIASPLVSTVYTVLATDANGCTAENSITIEVTTANMDVMATNNQICNGESTLITASGMDTYTWLPADGLNTTSGDMVTASPIVTTTYSVTGTDANACVVTQIVTIEVNDIDLIVSPSTTVCTGGSTDLLASGATNYTWTPATGLDNPNIANPTATPTTTTTYTVTGTNATGCLQTETVTITVGDELTLTPFPPVATVCASGEVALNVSGAVDYVWSPSAGLSATTGSTVMASPSLATIYTIVGTDANGCTATTTIDVSIADELTLTAVADPPGICGGGSTNISVSGAMDYVWSPATGLSSTTGSIVTANPAAPTTYTITGTNADGCTGTTTIFIDIFADPTAEAGADEAICTGNGITLNASGGVTYEWSPAMGLDNPNIATPFANPLNTTTYDLTVTDANGCTATDNVTVTVHEVIANAGADVSTCEGIAAPLLASGGVTYEWSPIAGLDDTNVANPNAMPLSTTNYTVTVTDANGCSDTDEVTVFVNGIVVDAGMDVGICENGATVLNASAGITYEWSPATGLDDPLVQNPNASPLNTTTYSVTVTDINGCSGFDEVTVTVNALTATAGADILICEGESTPLSALGGVNYEWSPAAGLDDPFSQNPMATPLSSTTYSVTVTDGNGCSGTDEMTITIDVPTADAGLDQAICAGETVALNASGGTIYAWLPITGLDNSNSQNPNANPLVTTTYTVTVENANGCIATDEVTITVTPMPLAEAGTDATICFGESTLLNASGGTTYEWSPATGLDIPNIANPTANPDITTTYTVTAYNGTCFTTDEVTIFVNPLPEVVAGVGSNVCFNDTYNLAMATAQNYNTLTWSGGSGTFSDPNSLNPIYTPGVADAGEITLTLTIEGDCGTLSDVVILEIIPESLTVDAGSPVTVCESEIISLSGFADAYTATNVTWTGGNGSFSDFNSAETDYMPATNETGAITLTLNAANECESMTDEVSIFITPLPQVNAGIDVTIYDDESTMLNATGAATFTWDFEQSLNCTDCANPIANPTETTTYFVTGTTDNCSNTAQVTVNVKPRPKIVLPTAFSPNNDGVNDVLRPLSVGVQVVSFRIYNRWGEMIFSTTSTDDGWDGRVDGQMQNMGVYSYVLEYLREDKNGGQLMKGNVTLVK